MKGLPGALLVALYLLAASEHLRAQQHCVTVRAGDTAATIAKRVTGDPRNRFEPWFQILDPATSRVVGKDDYDRIRPGWRACVITPQIRSEGRLASTPTARWTLDTLARSVGRLDSTVLLWAALALAIALTWSSLAEYVSHRRQMLAAMRRFGEAFVREFERPLLQHGEASRPIHSRLRANVQRNTLEVLLAPAAGRRYPNLSDHRTNVEYDVARVVQRLRDQSFVSGAPYAQGHWVVVPFEIQVLSKQAGAR